MGETTAISWTDHTFNPWWGCVRVSPACDNCYAETFAKRTGHVIWGKDSDRRYFGDKHWNEPRKWNDVADRNGVRARVFCASMADVFELRHDDAHLIERQRLWRLIEETPHLDWQLLTKRPENVLRMVPGDWLTGPWPANAWVGTTVESQDYANIRIPRLLKIPAPVRFLSMEPLLGPVTFRWARWDDWTDGTGRKRETVNHLDGLRRGIDWVIVGGESGNGHRPLDLEHARTIRDECAEAGVPFFFKQVGGRYPTSGGNELDGVVHHDFPRVRAMDHLIPKGAFHAE